MIELFSPRKIARIEYFSQIKRVAQANFYQVMPNAILFFKNFMFILSFYKTFSSAFLLELSKYLKSSSFILLRVQDLHFDTIDKKLFLFVLDLANFTGKLLQNYK